MRFEWPDVDMHRRADLSYANNRKAGASLKPLTFTEGLRSYGRSVD